MLRFPFLAEPLAGNHPAMPPGTIVRWRPLIPIHVIGFPGKHRFYPRTLVDSGADDTVFPIALAGYIGAVMSPVTSHGIRWRGQAYPLRFGAVEFELSDESGAVWRWPTTIGFSPAPIRYPILGQMSFLCFFDVLFLGDQRALAITANASFPGSIK